MFLANEVGLDRPPGPGVGVANISGEIPRKVA